MSDRKRTEEDALACLQRNGVRINEKTGTDGAGNKVVTARLIRPGIKPGLKVLTAIDCLVKYYPKRKYQYQSV